VRSALFLSTGPAEVAHLSDATVVADGRLVHVTPARGGLALVGVEIASEVARDSTRLPAARRRIGLFVPRPLGALQPGARALSEPVLFAPAATGPSVTDDHALVARMLGTTTLRRTPAGARRVGIYWESYGFAQSDTVDVALQISREDEANVLRRITTAVGVTDDVSGTRIETRWREPSGTRAALVGDEGPVTILMRSLVLDLGALARGRYRVEIEMRQPGGEAIRTGRSFSIE